jgi:hypothetical protein
MIAVPLVTAVYFMMNVAYMTVLTIPEMISAPAVAVVFTTTYSNLIPCTKLIVVSQKFRMATYPKDFYFQLHHLSKSNFLF